MLLLELLILSLSPFDCFERYQGTGSSSSSGLLFQLLILGRSYLLLRKLKIPLLLVFLPLRHNTTVIILLRLLIWYLIPRLKERLVLSRCCGGLQRSCVGPLLFMIFICRGGKIRQMRIIVLMLFALISYVRGSRRREWGTFKKLSREMMLLLRILEDVMRTGTLENTSCLLSLVMISSKTCGDRGCWLG